MRVAAICSIPRYGPWAHFRVANQALFEYGILLFPFSGAFWEQRFQDGLQLLLEQGYDAILTLDYDTIFEAQNVGDLLRLAAKYPNADALVPWQAKRGKRGELLFSVVDEAGQVRHHADAEEFEQPITEIATGHFGLTLLRTNVLRRMPKPWLWSQPDANGEWSTARTDADIYFWRKFRDAGGKVFLANTVSVGHLEEFVTWVDRDFQPHVQSLVDWEIGGKPEVAR